LQAAPYTTTLQATGGKGSLTWSAVGVFPSGIGLDATGKVSGTPAIYGNYGLSVQVQDSSAPVQTATTIVGLKIIQKMKFVTTGQLIDANRNIPYYFPVFVYGGVTPFTFTLNGGSIPPGMQFSADGQLTGITTEEGTFHFSVKVTDSGSPQQTATADYILKVDNILTVVTPIQLPYALQNHPYSTKLTAINGTPPYTWGPFGALPQWITLDSATGTITGTPSLVGAEPTGLTVTDSSSPPQTANFYGYVQVYGILTVDSVTIPPIQINSYSVVKLPVSGGVPPLGSSIISGSAPPGMTITFQPGIDEIWLVGAPRSLGPFTFGLRVQDSASPNQIAQGNVTVDVVPLAPIIKTGVLPDGIVGKPYSWGLAAVQGTPPYSWSISSGALPNGLLLDSTGLIHGSPTAGVQTQFIVLLTDSGAPAQTVSSTLTIQIHAIALGRNDSIATATPLTNGSFSATISPYSDPSTNKADGDYYRLTANPGSTVSVDVFAERLSPPSPLDPVIEILNSAGTPFATCKDPASAYLSPPLVADPNPFDCNNSCINDDDPGTGTTDSSLSFQVPGAGGGAALTFYLHVLDFRGDARPDMQYQLQIQGAN